MALNRWKNVFMAKYLPNRQLLELTSPEMKVTIVKKRLSKSPVATRLTLLPF
jgi:hypothetical protein